MLVDAIFSLYFLQYRLNLLAIFAAIGVFVLEIRDKQYWLSGIMGLIFVLLYTKFYLAPLILKHVMDPDFNKSEFTHIYMYMPDYCTC